MYRPFHGGFVSVTSIGLALGGWCGKASARLAVIDAETRNGSFESATLSPWSGVFGTQLSRQSVPGFAIEGQAYAQAQAAANPSTIAVANFAQSISLADAPGHTYALSWYGRTAEANGFAGTMGIFTSGGIGSQFDSSPSLRSDVWQRYSFYVSVPIDWVGSFQVGPSFRAQGPTGAVFTGYVDNVEMIQVPEPAAGMLPASLLLHARPRRIRPSKAENLTS